MAQIHRSGSAPIDDRYRGREKVPPTLRFSSKFRFFFNLVVRQGDALSVGRCGKTVIGALLVAAPALAVADAIIPYLVVPWGQLFLLPLVCFVEGAILYVQLGGSFWHAQLQSLVANIFSTLIGAGIYLLTSQWFATPLFHWWFKGGFATEAMRSAAIALGYAGILLAISWSSEAVIVGRLRRRPLSEVSWAVAIANATTYGLLLLLAIWAGA